MALQERLNKKKKVQGSNEYTLTFMDIYNTFEQAFKENPTFVNNYHYILGEANLVSNVAKIYMNNPNDAVVELYGNSIIFLQAKAFYSLKTNKKIEALLKEVHGFGRVLSTTVIRLQELE